MSRIEFLILQTHTPNVSKFGVAMLNYSDIPIQQTDVLNTSPESRCTQHLSSICAECERSPHAHTHTRKCINFCIILRK